ncbi:MAG: hypothetical protein REI64_06495 [Pedobacter sp.]|uniref:beta strand repeat-containing protein n=1 Tax=Pedobacter sp. TaxID=1411316 RepID=UPI0028087E49|nr:hypothetical protein [Pedobacter sp.]MDQ8004433.1 hypothetical protein [Pedobacter sp.]
MKSLYFIKKIIIPLLLLVILIGSCKKDEDRFYNVSNGRFQVFSEKSRLNGNVVENLPLTQTNKFNLVFVNPPQNAEAIISAEEVNGIYIDETRIKLIGTLVEIPVKGTPKYEGTFILILKIKIDGQTHVCSTKFFVDKPNVTSITLDLSEDVFYNAVNEVSREFTVYPRSIAFEIIAPTGLTVSIENIDSDKRRLKLVASDEFVAGDVIIKASFLQVPQTTKTIKVTAFSNGDGTSAKPYEIIDFGRFNRVRHALSSHYKLANDITGGTFITIAGSFTGSLDGDNKKISGIVINSPQTDNKAMFTELATTATIKNLELTTVAITAQNNVATIAVTNRGVIDHIKISGTVTGKQYVAGITANNFGTVSNNDVNALTVNADNFAANYAANTNSGAVQANNVIVSTANNFPANVYGITTPTASNFAFNPTDGTIEVKTSASNLTAVPVSGQQRVTFTPSSGFISGDVVLALKKGNVALNKTVKVYAKQEGSAFDGGDGSAANPYLISSEEGLIAMATGTDKHYKIIADFNLNRTWTPIASFSGSLDGNGHKVGNLNINSITANEGFFSSLSGTVKNLQLLNVNCTTSAAFGTLAGRLIGGTIQNVKITGDLTSTNTGDVLGGVVGDLSAAGKVTQVTTNLTIKASCGMVGGLVGRLTTNASGIAEISFSTAAGSIEISASKNRIAGILGRAEGANVGGGIIKNCRSSVNISATTAVATTVNGVGGIFGADQNAGIVPIDQCLFDGTISCGFSVGGIAGVGSTITNCLVEGTGANQTTPTIRATGTPATGNIGGIAGTNKVRLENCIVKNATFRATISTAALPVGGIASTYQNNGYTANSFIVNTSIEGSNTLPNGNNVFRISGTAANGTGANKKNYVGSGIVIPVRDVAFVENADGLDGATAPSTNQAFFETTLGFNFSIWRMGTDGYPALRNVGYNGTY